MNFPQSVLIIGFVWPEPNSSAAGSRMMQLLLLFLKQGCEITFACAASDSPNMADIESLGIRRETIALNADSFDVFVTNLNPSVVIFDRFMSEEQFGWRVAKHCPDALRLLDSEDLHCLRRLRQKALRKNTIFNPNDLLSDDDAKREIASILRCDLTLVISEYEMALLQQTFKIDPALLHYLPILIDSLEESLPGFEDRKDFVFIGNFFHEPNADAVKYLKEILWPKIHQLIPEALLHIYGAYPPESILQMHKPKEKFFVHGRAESAASVVKNSRVVLAPLRFGAGIKGKLLEAMQCGTPSITTSIGAEAMNGSLPWNGFVSDDIDEMAQAASRLYHDKALWMEAQENGFSIVKKRFLKGLFEPDLTNHIISLQQNLKSHREGNFLGAMLQFHTMRSTEYLSRWISEKNKNS
jgi:glycosyltransferase involved in cell wall biosynthesis